MCEKIFQSKRRDSKRCAERYVKADPPAVVDEKIQEIEARRVGPLIKRIAQFIVVVGDGIGEVVAPQRKRKKRHRRHCANEGRSESAGNGNMRGECHGN
ncbi:MAG TPA: hypothetical protein DCZ84_01520 [Candidatus Vogelbacteria bacterium]|nr:hypothetical protein [Candidatus Vogelbacteria bacterium]